ncbi:MAG: helix-turn-helix domain-containing protein [Longibaculum sp.]
MKSFSNRLIFAMTKKNIKQSELVKQTGINKGALSSYINGRYEPKQNNIYLLAKALDVNEAWLMGYDVPMERNVNDLFVGSELNLIFEQISKDLGLPSNLVKSIFVNLNLEANLELNYENVYLEIKKFLINNFNKNWDIDSKQLNLKIVGFNYLLQSIGWTYKIKEDEVDEYAYYELSNGDIKVKLTNEEFSNFEESIISEIKTHLQDIVIKSTNIFNEH